jgi:hypothetical protein
MMLLSEGPGEKGARTARTHQSAADCAAAGPALQAGQIPGVGRVTRPPQEQRGNRTGPINSTAPQGATTEGAGGGVGAAKLLAASDGGRGVSPSQ